MEFEQLQALWNQQSGEKVFVVNEADLHRRLVSECARIRRAASCTDFSTLGSYAFVGVALALQPLVSGVGYPRLAASALFLFVAAYAWWGRHRRLHGEAGFGAGLADLVRDTAARQRRQVAWLRATTWVGVAAYAAWAASTFYYLEADAPLRWVWLLAPLLAMVVIVGANHLTLQAAELPKLRRLEKLESALAPEEFTSETAGS